MIVQPLVMLMLLGYAATTDIEHLRTAVYDADKTQESRALIESYQTSNYFDIVIYVEREDDLAYLIDHGDVRGALVIPAGYSKKMASGERVDIAFLIDGSDPTVANTAFAASQQVGQAVSIKTIQQQYGAVVGSLPGVDVRPRVWYNPNLESSHFMIPGMMVIVLFMFTTLFTSTAIVRERELGTIEQLIVTIIEVLVLGVLVFGVPINGSVTELLGLAGLFIVTALGIGILISSVAGTQLEAFLLTFATLLPTVYLSGFIFPIDAMPGWLQIISYLIPARYAMVIMRGIILKGVGVELLIDQVVAVLIFSAVVISLAALRFKKKLE
jgi:ABC-2 type transport system permease protein